MFIQIIQGTVRDAELFHRQMERWNRDLRPGAAGFLGSTSGVTRDGRGILLARFDSADAARANSSRPEQGEWWAETEPAFDGAPEFHDCAEVDTVLGGGSDDAGFVQVIEGTTKDQSGMRQLLAEMNTRLPPVRPDILGMTVSWHGTGGVTQAVYFSSEAEARQGEKATDSDELRQRFISMFDGPLTFLDLTQPYLD